jgi:hypothetical protein
MSNVLDFIRAKVARAKQHLDEFQSALDAFYKTGPYRVDVKEDPNTRQRIYCVGKIDPVPATLTCIAADVLTNLRVPLDHISHQGVLQAIGTKPKGAVFYYPICATAKDYPSVRAKIKAMRKDLLDAIDATEPYEGGKGHALWQLNALNKPDKHELLVSAASSGMVDTMGLFNAVMGIRNGPSLFCGSSGSVTNVGDVLLTESNIDVQYERKFAFHVTFGDVRVSKCEPAIKTVHDIANLVDDIVFRLGALLS